MSEEHDKIGTRAAYIAVSHNYDAMDIARETAIIEQENEALRHDNAHTLVEIERLRAALKDVSTCVDNVGCYCADPPEDHEPPEDPDDWHTHSQYCPYYLQGYIADILAALKDQAG